MTKDCNTSNDDDDKDAQYHTHYYYKTIKLWVKEWNLNIKIIMGNARAQNDQGQKCEMFEKQQIHTQINCTITHKQDQITYL